MRNVFAVIRRYWFLSTVVAIVLVISEIFLIYMLTSYPFGKDIKIDTDKEADIYWPVRYDDGSFIDCPKNWRLDRVNLSIPFTFESPDAEGLDWVKKKIFPEVEDYKNDFDLAIKLMSYIHNKTEYSASDQTYETYFDLIKNVLKGGKFWCGSMSKSMMTASLSLGRNARLIHFQTAPDGDPDYLGHYAVEIWLPELKKWVLFDPTINIYYLYQKQVASTLEVHRACINGKARDVKVVKEGKLYSLETFNDKTFLPGVTLKNYFKHFQVIFRNDFLENGGIVRTANAETTNYYVNWVDEKTPAFYFKQELPAFVAKIAVLVFNGVFILLLLVGLSSKQKK